MELDKISRADLYNLANLAGFGAKSYNQLINWLGEHYSWQAEEQCFKLQSADSEATNGDAVVWENFKVMLAEARARGEEPPANVVLRVDSAFPFTINDEVYFGLPKLLFYRGDLTLLKRQLLGIVGTRRATMMGQSETKRLVEFANYFGLATISGLARGIDAMAHQYSLEYGVPTVAILPGSLGQITPPANLALAERIIDAGGLLLAEYPHPVEIGKHSFPQRNRIIAALASVTCVIEAPPKSGALITARQAMQFGRPVFVAVGDPTAYNLQGNFSLLDLYAQEVAPLTSSYHKLILQLGLGDFKKSGYNPNSYAQQQAQSLSADEVKMITLVRQGSLALNNHLAKLGPKSARQFKVNLAKLVASGLISRDNFGNLSVQI